jgi:hypothetical protein
MKKKREKQKYERRLPRAALLLPSASPWMKLFIANIDTALITVTGFNYEAFDELFVMFEKIFETASPYNKRDQQDIVTTDHRLLNPKETRGRHRLIDAKSCLGLVLTWYRFRGPYYILQGWFGLTSSCLIVWLNFGREIVHTILKNDKSKVEMPSSEKIQQYKDIIRRRHPVLQDVFCVGDGLKLTIQKPGDQTIQSRFYNGWTHGHYITNLFIFAPDGLIIFCVINAPGSVHDSTLAEWGDFYTIMDSIYDDCAGKCCMDSAFAGMRNNAIIRSSEDSYGRSAMEVLINREATSLRQAAEWGMRAIQSAFPRLHDDIRYEEFGSRQLILSVMVMLYNFRCDRVGLNQIQTVYVPEWSKSVLSVM